MDTTNWELKTSTAGTGLGLSLDFSSFSTSGHVENWMFTRVWTADDWCGKTAGESYLYWLARSAVSSEGPANSNVCKSMNIKDILGYFWVFDLNFIRSLRFPEFFLCLNLKFVVIWREKFEEFGAQNWRKNLKNSGSVSEPLLFHSRNLFSELYSKRSEMIGNSQNSISFAKM